MFIKRRTKSARAFTLTEVLVATGLFGIASAALMMLYTFSTRSFAVLANYAELDKINRTAVDTLTKELRQAYQVTDVRTNSISILTTNSASANSYVSVTYTFNPHNGKLMRLAGDGTSKVLLSDCELLDFNVYQRNNISNTFTQYEAATNDWSQSVKVVRLTWKAKRPVPGGPGVSENVQTARVVIRKQKE